MRPKLKLDGGSQCSRPMNSRRGHFDDCSAYDTFL